MSASTSASYRRVPQRETDEGSSSSSSAPNASPSEPVRSRGERLEDKFVALGWVVFAILLARWTDFFAVVYSDERPKRILLRIAAGLLLSVLAMTLYLTAYLSRVKGLTDPSVWAVYCPRVFPALCVTSAATYLVFVRAIWPLWGFLSPFIAGTEIAGAFMVLHFVPTFGFC